MRRPTMVLGLLPVALLALLVMPGNPVPAAPADKPDREELKKEWKAARAASAAGPKAATVKQNGVPHQILNIEFETAAACAAGCKLYAQAKNPAIHVVTRFGKFATALVPASTDKELDAGLDVIEKPNGMLWYDFVGDVEPPPPPPVGADIPPIGLAVPERIVRGGFKTTAGKTLTGKGVIVAVIDTGVDFRHPDFVRTTDGKKESRFLAIWDTHREFVKGVGQPGPVFYPGGAPVGTIFSRAELTADLEKKALGDFDVDSHGTSCAGIAAGNGSALEQAKKTSPDADLKKMDYRGVAPDADLIAVRISNTPGGPLENAWTLNAACDWIDKLAMEKKQPVVISCSFGAEAGGRDGFRIAERWLSDRLPEAIPGRLVFFAAGNEGDEGVHGSAKCDAGAGGVCRLTWALKADKAFIEVYVDPQDGQRLKKGDVTVEIAPKTAGNVGRPYINALSGSVVFPVAVTAGGSLSLTSPNGQALVADAYLNVRSGKTGPLGKFTGLCVKNEHQLRSPATATAAFAVGSYDFNHLFLLPKGMFETRDMEIGKLSSYSNAGYVRGKTIVKPEFAAPGQWHLAACPDPVPKHVIERNLLAMTEKYQRFNGTSAATPYAAGVAALLLEKEPTMTAKKLRGLIEANATKDTITGPMTNPQWGHGKLDLKAVGRLLN